jgi:hypothetical protein
MRARAPPRQSPSRDRCLFRTRRTAEHGTRHLCAKCQDHGASLQSVAPRPSAAPNGPACRHRCAPSAAGSIGASVRIRPTASGRPVQNYKRRGWVGLRLTPSRVHCRKAAAEASRPASSRSSRRAPDPQRTSRPRAGSGRSEHGPKRSLNGQCPTADGAQVAIRGIPSMFQYHSSSVNTSPASARMA